MKTMLRKVIASLLVLSMVFAAVPWTPQERVYAKDSAFRYYEAGDWVKFLAPFYLTHLPADWHDYQFEEKGDSSFDFNTYVKLTKDISYEVGHVEHNNGATWAVVLGDIVSAGLMEILWDKIDQKRPRYIDDKGNTVWTAGDVENFLRAGTYGVTKVLDLNGHDFVLKYPNMNCHSATLFDVSHCDLYITDSVGGGSIKLDGYITAPDDYNYFKEIAGDDQQRDIFYVHDDGRLFINGGLIEAGRSKTEAGFTIFNADVRDSSDHYTGSATRYVNGTAIRIGDGGEVVINGGTVEGRGYEHISDSGKYADRPNAVIEMTGGKLTINGGTINAKGGANILSVDGNAEVKINAGRFNLHKNDNLFCGLAYGSDNWYEIETKTDYGSYGFTDKMFPDATHTTVKYGSKKTTANDIQTAIKARPTSLDVYPSGGMYNMKVANVEKDKDKIPDLDPAIESHMTFTLDLPYDSSGKWKGDFGKFYPEYLYPIKLRDDLGANSPKKWMSSNKITYEAQIFDADVNVVEFKRDGKTCSSSIFRPGSNSDTGCVVNLKDASQFGDLTSRLKDGELYHLIVTMTETFYGATDTWTVESAAGRAFYVKTDQPLPIADSIASPIVVEQKGDKATLTAKGKNGGNAWWVVRDSFGNSHRVEADSNNKTGDWLTSKVSIEVDDVLDVCCVFSNSSGTAVTNHVQVSYRPSFLKTEDEKTTAFKDLWLTLSQPLDLNEYKSITWYRNYNGTDIQYTTSNPNTVIINGTTLKVKPISEEAVAGDFYCIVVSPDGKSAKKSKTINVTYSEETPEKYITTADITANNVFNNLCIGDEVPTKASQLSCEDPRVEIKSITWENGVYYDSNSGKYYINCPYPSCTIKIGVPEGSEFRYKRAVEGNDDFSFTMDGVSKTKTGAFNGLPENMGASSLDLYVEFDNHSALTTPLDMLTYTPEEIRVQSGAEVDKTIDFTLGTNSRFLNAGQAAHAITGVEAYTGQNALPAGLSLEKVDADTYRVAGTVTDTPGTHTTLLKVSTNAGDSGNSSHDAVIRFYIVPGAEAAEESLKEAQASQHLYHNWGSWIDNNDGTHSHYCKEEGCDAVETSEHVWDDGTVIKEATIDADGTKRFTCGCGATKEEDYSYELIPCTLTFQMNDGTGTFGHIDAHKGETISFPTLSGKYAHPDGLTFRGWSTSASGGSLYRAGTTLEVTGDMEFFAQWRDASTPSGGGGGGGGSATPEEPAPAEPAASAPEAVPAEYAEKADDTFQDVEADDWFAAAVGEAVENGVIAGVSKTRFAPADLLTRGMLVQMLYAMAGAPGSEGGTDFTDVSDSDWYAKAIDWASAQGIAAGYGEEFGPNDPVTREQMVTMLQAYAEKMGYEIVPGADLSAYVDEDTISSWAEGSVAWAKAADLITGRSETMLVPKGTATRAETVVIMMNFQHLVSKEGE